MQDAYGFENKDFLKHIQIRSQLTKYLGEKLTIPKLTETESKLKSLTEQIKIALSIYKLIQK